MSLNGTSVAEVKIETAAEEAIVEVVQPALLISYPQRKNSLKDSIYRVKEDSKKSEGEFEKKYKNEPMPTPKHMPPY